MYIKEITMCGFRAYKNQTRPERFSPGVNGLVGKNGSGKSTVVQAIMFVIAEADERSRQANINDDKSRTEQSAAWVEILFDNSDDRLPGYGSEVRIKRTVGLKKNEYHINGQHKTKEEIVNTLENAGFSRSNPYYYVAQGKIREFMDMDASKRLEMLKEIAGAKTFEERRQTSLKEFERTELDRQEIQRDLDKIEEQLRGLDADTAQLREYNEVDKERRILEYCVLRKSLQDAQARLDDLRSKFSRAQEGGAAARERSLRDSLRETEEKITELEGEVSRKEQARRAAADASREAGARVAELESDDRDARESARESAAQAKEKEAALREQRKRLDKARRAAEEKEAALEEAVKAEAEAETRAKDLDKRLAPLLSKANFKNRKERDAHLKKELAEAEESLKATTAAVEAKKAELARLRADLAKRQEAVKELEAAHREKEEAGRDVRRRAEERRAEQVARLDERKELERRSQELEGEVKALEAERQKAQGELEKAIPAHVRKTWREVQKVVQEHNIGGVHGPIIELFQCHARYNRAVEAVAGNALFHVVVDTDEIAVRISKHLRESRCTFFPLNKLMDEPPLAAPTKNEVPMLKILTLRDGTRFQPAFNQIFGKHFLCSNLDTATESARRHNIDTVTLEGDCAHRKGSLEGGYDKGSTARIEPFRTMQEKGEAAAARAAEREKLLGRIDELRRLADQTGSEAAKLEASAESNLRDVSALAEELKFSRRQLQTLEQSEAAAAKYVRDQEAARAGLQERLADVRRELQTELPAALSSAEQGQMDELLARSGAAEKELRDAKTKREDLEGECAPLRQRLAKAEEQVSSLEAEIAELKQSVDEAAAAARAARLAEAREAAGAADGRAKAAEAEVAALQKRAAELAKEAGKVRKEVEEAADEAAAQQATVDEFRAHEAAQLRKIEEYNKKIRELGALPADAHAQHTGSSLKQLTHSLEKVRAQLKKFGTVNKRARDQLAAFTEQRDTIGRKMAEVNRSRDSIVDMMRQLEQQKDELLNRTFKQVSVNLKKVFSELVPGGDINFVLTTAAKAAGASKKRGRAELSDDEEEDGEGEGAAAARGAGAGSSEGGLGFVGAKIKARFAPDQPWQELKPLSGGQRSIIALALIFAIQRCDPSPFYLFDEVDDSLDTQFKTAVAKLIRTQADAQGVQFFTVTFSKQLVEVCDKVYGSKIKRGKKESEIDCITKAAALRFVEAEERRAGHHAGGEDDEGEGGGDPYQDEGGDGGSYAAGEEEEGEGDEMDVEEDEE